MDVGLSQDRLRPRAHVKWLLVKVLSRTTFKPLLCYSITIVDDDLFLYSHSKFLEQFMRIMGSH